MGQIEGALTRRAMSASGDYVMSIFLASGGPILVSGRRAGDPSR